MLKKNDTLKVVPTVKFTSVTNGSVSIDHKKINGSLALTSNL